MLDGLELGRSLEVRAEPPVVQPSGVPKSVPLGALHGAVPRVVTAPLPPPDPPPSRSVLVGSTRGGRFVPPEPELDSTERPTTMAATTTPASHPTTTPASHPTTTTTNPQNKAANDRPRRSTADYNRTYEFTVKIQRKQSERTTTDMKATAFTVGVGGEGETQDDASEEESQTAVHDGAGSDSDSEGEGELSEGGSECEGVRVSRDCVRPSRNNKSSVYNHLVSSTDCCRTYSHSCFSVLCRARHGYLMQLQVLEAVCQRIHKLNLCVQKDSVITLKLFK